MSKGIMPMLTQIVPAAKHSAWRRQASVQTSYSGCTAEAVNSDLVFQSTVCCDGPDEGVAELMLVCPFAPLCTN